MSNSNAIPPYPTILDELPPQLVADYIAQGLFKRQSFAKNTLLHIEGEFCQQIEIILEGDIVIERIGEAGDLMTVNHFHQGDIIGANLIFSSTDAYPMTITAKKNSQVITIQKDILFELCNSYPRFLMAFIRIISDLSVLIATKMKNRITRTIRQSIITYINRQYQLQGTTTLRLTMSKKALAEMFGVSRTSLSRELQKMADEGLITYDARSIVVLNQALIQEHH